MLFANLPLLSLLVWTPIVGAILVFFAGGDRNPPLAKGIALLTSIVSIVLAGMAYWQFDNSLVTMQLQEKHMWIDRFLIYYHLGVDGISLPLIMLTAVMGLFVIIAGWRVIQVRVAQYMASFLIMQGLMCGVFSALDSMLFYVFWEAMLIPMFIIIGVWGGPNRVYATIKFFLYTFLGSVFMLIALLSMYNMAGTFDIQTLQNLPMDYRTQVLVFLAFLAAFSVKIPMFPVHTWLPDAHVEAPTGGSVILAAIMLKLGGYGFLRFSLPIAPDASMSLAWLMIALSLIAVIYIAFVAIVQSDMKKLIAYSSIAHMGFVTLGFFVIYLIVANTGSTDAAVMAVEGGMVQMISHGFISGALFLCVGVLYDRMHSRNIADYGGVVNKMPLFAALMMVFIMANSGLPGTSGFVGEFFVIISTFQASAWLAIAAATILILGPAYNLWLYKRVIYGPVANEQVEQLKDVSRREFWMLSALAALVFLFGVWPQPMFETMHTTVAHLVAQATTSKL